MSARYKNIKINGKTYLEHRVVMERAIGRKLSRNEHVHHRNQDRFDNRLENLEVLDPKSHMHLHKQKHPVTKVCAVCKCEYTPHPTKRARSRTCGKPKCYFSLIGAAHRKIPADRVAEVVRMRRDGRTLQSIADIFGVTKQAVAWTCKKSEHIAFENVVLPGVLGEPPKRRRREAVTL